MALAGFGIKAFVLLGLQEVLRGIATSRIKLPSSSKTQARPPVMPAPKLKPVAPRTTTRPPVMYSQPWSPTPSTMARAPELRTAKRSPARPAAKRAPLVAP